MISPAPLFPSLTVIAADAAPQGGGIADLLFPLAMVFLIFWFLVIRPSSKERKQRETAVRNITKHDKVVTNAGIHGTVVGLDDETVMLRVDDKNNVRIRFSRAAVWQVNPLGSSASSSKDGASRKTAAGAS